MTTHIIEKAATKLEQGHAEGATAPIRKRPADKKLFHGLRRSGDGLGVLRTVVWVAIAFLVGLPLAALAVQGIQPAARQVFGDPAVATAALNSVASASGSALLSTIAGAFLAVVLERSNVPSRVMLRWLVLLPFLIPPFIGAMAWMALLGANGPVNKSLQWLGINAEMSIFGGWGVVFLLAVHSYPVAYLVIAAALRRIPGNLEEAARISGAGTAQVLRSVTLPLLRPGLLAAFVLTLVANMSDFGIPALIGLPERYTTLTTLVYRYLASSTTSNPLPAVSAIGLVLLALAVLTVLVQRRLPTGTQWGSGATGMDLELGRARLPLVILLWSWVAIICLVPLLALATQALLPAPGVPLTWENLTMDNIIRASTSPGAVSGVGNSVMLAGGAAVCCTLLGMGIALLLTRGRHRSNGPLDVAATLPQALPGLVIAVGWLLIAPMLGIFNTGWVILGAYVMAFTALVVQAVRAPMDSVSSTLEDAARSAGATPLRALLDVTARLAGPAAVTGGVVVLLTAVRELTISILLVAPGSQTLGVTIFNLQQSGDYGGASALALVVALVGILGLSATAALANRRADK
ncbi:iron ABC transporter permease [Paeniglutamicibacter sp. ZC-3]|uniref:ABC transporter permease n=1 Tax=Paeniglutamicibacter sp. ZC-3 TaxID=2986919 RepID=UPI0021F7D4D3|nr:iron ABC transporter permease [Paeniglutamicibacter sp. ZC-3]MCV9993398.1 iron ABC transporter permease [Paeniglutamicibacter sp. ZC-3]